MVSNYLQWKDDVVTGKKRTDPEKSALLNFLNDYETKCGVSWADFITKYRFVRHANSNNIVRSIYNILPNSGSIMNPSESYLEDKMPSKGYIISYDFRAKIVFKRQYETLVFDFDYQSGITLEGVAVMLENIVTEGLKYGINFVFALFPSDRGIHVYLLSHKFSRNMIWVDFLRTLCDDAYHIAFAHNAGFGARLTKKTDQPNDKVIWINPLQERVIDETIPNIQPPFDVDTNIQSRVFMSEYLNSEIEIKMPQVEQLNIIGDTQFIKNNLLLHPYMDYVLVQYFSNIDVSGSLESEIYDQFLFPFKSNMDSLRNDIETLAKMCYQMFGVEYVSPKILLRENTDRLQSQEEHGVRSDRVQPDTSTKYNPYRPQNPFRPRNPRSQNQ